MERKTMAVHENFLHMPMITYVVANHGAGDFVSRPANQMNVTAWRSRVLAEMIPLHY
jgi:hypothetical protein